MNSEQILEILINALKDKKAKDIVKIYVGEKTIIADYFLICDAPSANQVKAICENAEEQVEKAGGSVLRKEGIAEGRWAVIDFGGVICHVFNSESREFYRIERLWVDGDNVQEV